MTIRLSKSPWAVAAVMASVAMIATALLAVIRRSHHIGCLQAYPNPIAADFPTDGDPVLIDISMSTTTNAAS